MRILERIRGAMTQDSEGERGSKCLVNDATLPDSEAPLMATAFDITMMAHHSGLERSEAMWRALVERVEGLKVLRVWKPADTEGIVEVEGSGRATRTPWIKTVNVMRLSQLSRRGMSSVHSDHQIRELSIRNWGWRASASQITDFARRLHFRNFNGFRATCSACVLQPSSGGSAGLPKESRRRTSYHRMLVCIAHVLMYA